MYKNTVIPAPLYCGRLQLKTHLQPGSLVVMEMQISAWADRPSQTTSNRVQSGQHTYGKRSFILGLALKVQCVELADMEYNIHKYVLCKGYSFWK